MNEEDYIHTYRKLAGLLSEFKLEWVVEQVTKNIQEEEKPESLELNFMEDFRVKEYGTKEKLLFLIDAIEQAVVNTVEIEYDITSYLKQQNLISEVKFYSSDDREEEVFIFDPNVIEARNKSADELKKYLNYLREEIASSDS